MLTKHAVLLVQAQICLKLQFIGLSSQVSSINQPHTKVEAIFECMIGRAY